MANKNTNPGGGELAVPEVMNKERDKEKGKSPHTPLKEKETEKETFPEPVPEHRARTCARTCASACVGAGAGACVGAGAGAGARAREGASRSGSGAVDICHGSSGAGSANRVKIDRDFIMAIPKRTFNWRLKKKLKLFSQIFGAHPLKPSLKT